MPSAIIKYFRGISPRERGSTTYAQEAVNVDLFGKTLRPFFANSITPATGLTGTELVKYQGRFVSLAGETNVRVGHYRGFNVRFYKRGGDWFKRVGNKETRLGLTTPSKPELSIFRQTDPILLKTEAIRIFSGTDTVFKSKADILPEDTYTYFVEYYQKRGGQDIVLAQSSHISVPLRYAKKKVLYLDPDGPLGYTLQVTAQQKQDIFTGTGELKVTTQVVNPILPTGEAFQGVGKGDPAAQAAYQAARISVETVFVPVKEVLDIDYSELDDVSIPYRRNIGREKATIVPSGDAKTGLHPWETLIEGIDHRTGRKISVVAINPAIERSFYASWGIEVTPPPYVGDRINDEPVHARAYRKGDKDLVFRLVSDTGADGAMTSSRLAPFHDVRVVAGKVAPEKKKFTYFTTFVRLAGASTDLGDFEEESGPSEQAILEWFSVGTMIKRPTGTLSEFADRAITKWNIYRLEESSTGTADFQLVESVDIANADYSDYKGNFELGAAPSVFALVNGVNFAYADIPKNITNISRVHNNMLFAWRENELYWTDVGTLHGFTGAFTWQLAHKIVTAVSHGNVLIVLTTHKLYRVLGADSTQIDVVESPSQDGMRIDAPKAAVSTDAGVVFLSDSGLHVFDGSVSASLTDPRFGEEFFRGLNLVNSIIETNDGMIFLFYDTAALIFDTRSGQSVTLSIKASAVYRDNESGILYVRTPKGVEGLFEKTNSKMSYDYHSGTATLVAPLLKRIRSMEFHGVGEVTVTPIYDGIAQRSQLAKMEGMERDRRVYPPMTLGFNEFSFRVSGTGEVEEILIEYERV